MDMTRTGMLLKGVLNSSVREPGAIFGPLLGTQCFASRGTLMAEIFISGKVSLLLGRVLNFSWEL